MTDKQKEKFERLEGFKSLEEGWDGFYAHPVNVDAINFLQKVILTMTDEDLSKWNVFPSLNGGVMLSRRFKQNGFLYFTDHNICSAGALPDDRKEHMTWKFPITDNIDEVIDIINKIDKFFKEDEGKRTN